MSNVNQFTESSGVKSSCRIYRVHQEQHRIHGPKELDVYTEKKKEQGDSNLWENLEKS